MSKYKITTVHRHTVSCRLYAGLTDNQETKIEALESCENVFLGCIACGPYIELENENKDQLIKDIAATRKLLGAKLHSKKNRLKDEKRTQEITER